jgi:hypothetical protein
MNLLNDQREPGQQSNSAQEKQVPEKPEFGAVAFDREIPHEEIKPAQEFEEPLTSYAGSRPKKSKTKSSKSPILLFIAAALVIVVVGYIGFFKKSGDKLSDAIQTDNNPTQQSSPSETIEPPTLEQNQGQPTIVPRTDKSAELLGNIMSTIVESIPGSSKLLTLFLDEGSFSIELAGQSSDLSKFQNGLKAGLPADAKVSGGSISGGKTLVSGSFPRGKGRSGNTLVEKEQALEQLSLICKSVGAQVLEKSAGQNVVTGNSSRAMIHFKVSGSVEQCQNVLAEFAQKDWNIQISKVILLPLNQQRANLVLRFLLANSA